MSEFQLVCNWVLSNFLPWPLLSSVHFLYVVCRLGSVLYCLLTFLDSSSFTKDLVACTGQFFMLGLCSLW